jgi:hypothetical protein
VNCACGANCQPRRLPDWLLAQLNDARHGLLAISGIATDGFCCPLCVRVLPESCATLAHAPSKEVGGDGATFLCKPCNSFLGTAYEGAADEFISSIAEAKRTGSVKQKISIGHRDGVRLYMDAVFSGTTDANRRIEAEPIRPNPDAEERFAVGREQDQVLLLRFRVPSEDHVKLAYLSWAFLLLFRRLGYVFVFSRSGQLARTALMFGSTKGLSPAFFFSYGDFEGEMSPIATGLLVRTETSDFDGFAPVAIGADIGNTVIALPLAEDPTAAYDHLLEYTADGSKLLVLPFDEIYPGHATAMQGIAAYRWQSRDGAQHRLFGGARHKVAAALAHAIAPPSGRPKVRGPLRHNPDWPPPVLPLPPEPRTGTWRAIATEYLATRDINVTPSSKPDDDDAWIAEVERVDQVAARHISDMRSMFLLGDEPHKRTGPRGVEVMPDLNRVAGEAAEGSLVVASDFRLVDAAEDYASLSARVVSGDDDIVVGPHYTYETLVFALHRILKRQERPGLNDET